MTYHQDWLEDEHVGISNLSPRRVSSPRIDVIEKHIEDNLADCSVCGLRIFWSLTTNGKKIPLDFGDRGRKTHFLVATSDKDGYTGEVTAWVSHKKGEATHSCHFDSSPGCRKKKR